jgi:predicted O-linked N-acetylglucosamine transferase (SPINDLY family)
VTDPYLDPPGAESAYVEELVRLPDIAWCYQPYATLPVNRLPALRTGHVTFASFNVLTKLTPQVISLWSRILKALPGARLLLVAWQTKGEPHVLQAFRQHGIGKQVQVRHKRPVEQYLQMYHEVDIGLDPFPFTGGITTCDALWMGVPVITLSGPTCVSRQGVSLLSNLGLAGWIAETPDAVVDLACRWAQDLPRVAQLRAGLRHMMKRSVLLDRRGYTRSLEEAYRAMWRKWCVGQRGE